MTFLKYEQHKSVDERKAFQKCEKNSVAIIKAFQNIRKTSHTKNSIKLYKNILKVWKANRKTAW